MQPPGSSVGALLLHLPFLFPSSPLPLRFLSAFSPLSLVLDLYNTISTTPALTLSSHHLPPYFPVLAMNTHGSGVVDAIPSYMYHIPNYPPVPASTYDTLYPPTSLYISGHASMIRLSPLSSPLSRSFLTCALCRCRLQRYLLPHLPCPVPWHQSRDHGRACSEWRVGSTGRW